MDSLFPGRRTTVAIHSERPRVQGKPCLIVISGPGMNQRVELDDEDVDIGRSEECRLYINSDQVSRRHAAVLRIAGRYVVTDLNSTNGTYLNDQKVKTAQLEDGDQIRVGKTVLRYTESHVEREYFDHIMNLATVDALTGAFNKRKFDEMFRAEVTRAEQTSIPLSLMLFDIDFFKRINDGFGHPAGDAVLQGMASLGQAIVGPNGTLSRVGGEEFVVLLPGNDVARMREMAEYLRRGVEQHHFTFEGQKISVTISIGVAELAPKETTEAFYKRADELLYQSKHGGRNRVSG